jgi:glucose-6-phosphate 1-epimerase
MADVHDLNQQFGIRGIAEVVEGEGGLACVKIATQIARGEVYLHGAQVTSWVPEAYADVLFLSWKSRWEQGKAIRGGVPICFPWFGNKADDPKAPAHGFARTRSWNLESIAQSEDAVQVVMSIESDRATKMLWPHEFHALYTITFGTDLKLELQVTNKGETGFTFEEALHTYYKVGNVVQAKVAGLDGVHYLDKTDGNREKQIHDDISISSETDRVFLNTAHDVEIRDNSLRRRTVVSKQHSSSTVVWNPWVEKSRSLSDLADDEWEQFVCVEAGNVGDSAVRLGPGQEHRITAVTNVGPLT